MAIATSAIHILRLLLQADQNLSGLQRDMVNNANTWSAAANSASIPLAILQQQILDAAASYNTRLGWIAIAQANGPVWTALSAMWVKFGGTGADFTNIVNPLQTAANNLQSADLSTYAAIVSACSAITSSINAPVSLWPE